MVEGCGKPIRADSKHGWCTAHRTETSRNPLRICGEPGCTQTIFTKNKHGWCLAHFNKNMRTNYSVQYNAKKAALHVEDVDRARVLDSHRGVCHICGGLVDPTAWHLDHVIPVTLGGPHCYANVAPSHPGCNTSKNNHWAGSPVKEIDAAARQAFAAFHGHPFA